MMKIYGIENLRNQAEHDEEIINTADANITMNVEVMEMYRDDHVQFKQLSSDIRVAQEHEKIAKQRENARAQFVRAVDRNIREGILTNDFNLEPIRCGQADDLAIINNMDKKVEELERQREAYENGHYEFCHASHAIRDIQRNFADAKARQQIRVQFERLMARMRKYGVQVELHAD